jgi:hypothetical protein
MYSLSKNGGALEKFTPRGQNSPLGDKVAPWVKVKNGPLAFSFHVGSENVFFLKKTGL